jgi:hypothetical protein
VKLATHDRGAALNLAGFHHLSPALRDGLPVLVGEGETAGRIGWETFFAALEQRDLVLSWDTEDPGSVASIPASEGRNLKQRQSPD